MSRRNIAIFHTGALGDFVLTWFIPLALRQLFPEHQITYITHGAKGRLAQRLLGTDCNDIDTNGWHSLFSSSPALHVSARELLDRSDAAISFVAESTSSFAANLKALAPGLSLSSLIQLPPEGYTSHITFFYLQQLGQHFPAEPFERAIQGLATQGLPGMPPPRGRILLHPGAGATRKCWALDSYLDLAEAIRARNIEVAIMLGEAELDRFPARVLEELKRDYSVVSPNGYVELTEELLNSQMVITNDNGPGHLAAVSGCHVLSIFGPTDARVWRPVGPRARVLAVSDLNALTPGQVLEAISPMLSIG